MQTIREAAVRRPAQSIPAIRLDELCASVPITHQQERHGQHIGCYKKFTNDPRLQGKVPSDLITASVANSGVPLPSSSTEKRRSQ